MVISDCSVVDDDNGMEVSDLRSNPILFVKKILTREMPTIYLTNQFFKNIIFTRIKAFRNFLKKFFFFDF